MNAERAYAAGLITASEYNAQANRIELSRNDAGEWFAKFAGAYRSQIVDLFGTDTLLAAYTAGVDADSVLTAVRMANPNCVVTVRR